MNNNTITAVLEYQKSLKSRNNTELKDVLNVMVNTVFTARQGTGREIGKEVLNLIALEMLSRNLVNYH